MTFENEPSDLRAELTAAERSLASEQSRMAQVSASLRTIGEEIVECEAKIDAAITSGGEIDAVSALVADLTAALNDARNRVAAGETVRENVSRCLAAAKVEVIEAEKAFAIKLRKTYGDRIDYLLKHLWSKVKPTIVELKVEAKGLAFCTAWAEGPSKAGRSAAHVDFESILENEIKTYFLAEIATDPRLAALSEERFDMSTGGIASKLLDADDRRVVEIASSFGLTADRWLIAEASLKRVASPAPVGTKVAVDRVAHFASEVASMLAQLKELERERETFLRLHQGTAITKRDRNSFEAPIVALKSRLEVAEGSLRVWKSKLAAAQNETSFA